MCRRQALCVARCALQDIPVDCLWRDAVHLGSEVALSPQCLSKLCSDYFRFPIFTPPAHLRGNLSPLCTTVLPSEPFLTHAHGQIPSTCCKSTFHNFRPGGQPSPHTNSCVEFSTLIHCLMCRAVVSKGTTIHEVTEMLLCRRLVPSSFESTQAAIFTSGIWNRKLKFSNSMEKAGLGPLSHLHFRFCMLGGSSMIFLGDMLYGTDTQVLGSSTEPPGTPHQDQTPADTEYSPSQGCPSKNTWSQTSSSRV
jgi:hypothetical protein